MLVVIDPFPATCKISYSRLLYLKKLKKEGCPINFIINKWNSGIEEKTFLTDVGVNPLTFIPAIDLSILYKADYNCKIAYSYKGVSDLPENPFKKIASLFIPKEFIGGFYKNKIVKKRTFFSYILRKLSELKKRKENSDEVL